MADKAGFFWISVSAIYHSEYVSTDIYSGGAQAGNSGASVGSLIPGSNKYFNATPVSVTTWPTLGYRVPYYFDDYYNRVHISPSRIDVGNLLSTVTSQYRIWNANLEPEYLNSVTYTGTDGISINSDAVIPGTVAALRELSFAVSATLDGPPTLDANIYYDFAEGTNDVSVVIVGRRIVTWPFMPQTEVKERLEWRTEILSSYDKEQRVSLRLAPRQSLEYDFICDPQQFSRMKAAAYLWSHRLYGVPIWYDAVRAGTLAAGATTITIDTRYSDFNAGGLALVWVSDVNNEVVEIVSKTTSSITIKRGLLNEYPSPLVAPIQLGFTPNGVSFDRTPSDMTRANVKFELTGNTRVAQSFTATTYKGYYVVTDYVRMFGGVDENISRPLDIVDSEAGPRVLDVSSNLGNRRAVVTSYAKSMSERWNTRSWFHYLNGKQKAFWLPTWNKDIELLSVMLNSSLVMNVRNIGFTLFVDTADIMVVMKNGTRYYNRVLSSEVMPDGAERLSVENLFPVNLYPEEIERISFIHLVRLDTDTVEFNYNAGVLEVSAVTKGVSA